MLPPHPDTASDRVARRRVKTGAFVLIGLALTGLAVPFLAFYLIAQTFHASGCEMREVLAREISPDGAWIATVYHSSWSDGGFVTTITDTVEIMRPDEPASPCPSAGTVFAMDAVRPHSPIAVTWTGPRRLEVRVPNDAEAGPRKASFADVAISYQ